MSTSGRYSIRSPGADETHGSSTRTAGDSILVSVCTLLSRVTGVLKVAAIGAVFGPTVFGNIFQLTNTLPNLVFYGFLAGSLFSSLLVPSLVGHLDAGDRRAAERVAGGFLGLTWLAMVAVLPLAVLAGPLLLKAVGPTVTTMQPAMQEHVGRMLVVLFLPQMFCYAVVGTASAAMNARQRFMLAAAAPAMENIGIIVVLGVAETAYGNQIDAGTVSNGELLLLGLGTTGAVVLHASVQWWGARRVGIRLVPRAGWRDPPVQTVVRRAAQSIAQAGLEAVQLLALLALANRIAGGVVAFQISLNFFYLAIALGATPVALSVLPRLARLELERDLPGFRDATVRGFSLALFIAIPSAIGYLALARPIARMVSVGRMGTDAGIAMVVGGLVPLAFAVVAQTAFSIASYACYARKDVTGPLRSMALQTVCCLGFAGFAVRTHGAATMAVLGTAFAGAITVAAAQLIFRLRRRLGRSAERVGPSLMKISFGAAVMAGPAWLTAQVVGSAIPPPLSSMSAVLAAVVVGVVVFGGSQFLLRTKELAWLGGGVLQLVTRQHTARSGVGRA